MREEGSTPAKGTQEKWVKGDIWTRCLDGMRPVSAETCGPLAVHRTIDGPGWRITHVPTGYAFPHIFKWRAAKRAAKVLLTLEPVNFWASQSEVPKASSAWWRRARKAYITAMKEIGVEYE